MILHFWGGGKGGKRFSGADIIDIPCIYFGLIWGWLFYMPGHLIPCMFSWRRLGQWIRVLKLELGILKTWPGVRDGHELVGMFEKLIESFIWRVDRRTWRARMRACKQCPVHDPTFLRCRAWGTNNELYGCGCFTPYKAMIRKPYVCGCWGYCHGVSDGSKRHGWSAV